MPERKKTLVTLFILFIFVASTAGFIIGGPLDSGNQNQDIIEYKGQTFILTQQGWVTQIQDKSFLFSTPPTQLEDINIFLEPFTTLQNLAQAQKVYLTRDPLEIDNTYLTGLSVNILPYLKRVVLACPQDSEECSDLPLITCEQATPTVQVIQIQSSNQTKVQYTNNCLLIEAPQTDILRVIDKVSLTFLGL